MDAWRKAAVVAAVLVSSASTKARADDFVQQRAWSLEECQTYNFFRSGVSTSSKICADGVVNYGFSAALGQYGFTYNFATTIFTPPPVGATLFGYMIGVRFGWIDGGIPNTVGPGCLAFGCTTPLVSGSFFSPHLTDTSPLVEYDGYFFGQDPLSPDPTSDDRWTRATVTATPEPATLALLAPGLVGLGAMARRRRRR